jgi:hypothetical protein
MSAMVEALTSWHLFVFVLLVFGVLPGFVLRALAAIFPRGDARRAEMLGEFRAVPSVGRPLWVAQQVEVAAFEGLPARLHALKLARARQTAAKRRAGKGRHRAPERPRVVLLPGILLAASCAAFAGLASTKPAAGASGRDVGGNLSLVVPTVLATLLVLIVGALVLAALTSPGEARHGPRRVATRFD